MSVAKFSIKTKKEIVERDKYCIICWKQGTDCHHVKYWVETNYWPDRNHAKEWVLLCRDCHQKAHSCSRWEWVRQQAIDYITNL